MKASLSLLITALSASQAVGAYNLIKTFSGSTFFDEWTYINDWDHWTNGDIQYLPRATAGNLTTVNAAGNAVIRVDDFTAIAEHDKRNSIRLESTHILNNTNTVLVYDVVHIPYGCSVWGSLWTKSAINQWPIGGELDVMEAVNRMTNNQMALHTKSACTIPATNPNQSGSVISPNCQLQQNADGTFGNTSGCTINDPGANSYSEFDTSNGGVWVAEFAPTGVSIWFFTRSAVPTGLADAQTLDTSTLGIATANFPSSSTCDITQALDPQQMIIDITLCGDWAGHVLDTTGCAANASLTCYDQYVYNVTNYHEAYFEIASIKVFGDDTTFLQNSTLTSSATHTGTGTRTGTGTGVHSTPTTTTSTNSALSWGANVALWSPCSILMLGVTMMFTM